VDAPIDDVAGCRAAHARMLAELEGLTDVVARQPSLLPGWTVGHVVAHLARNAEASVRRVQAAVEGKVVEQYVGGAEGRAAEIEAGAGRAAADLVADAAMWSQRLDAEFASFPEDGWSRPVRSVKGGEHPVATLPFHRWREVEIHLLDLGLGFTSEDWSPGFVDRSLPELVAGLGARTSTRALMAWLLGRGAPPELESWG
jgi:maleylpyruvate isomerase